MKDLVVLLDTGQQENTTFKAATNVVTELFDTFTTADSVNVVTFDSVRATLLQPMSVSPSCHLILLLTLTLSQTAVSLIIRKVAIRSESASNRVSKIVVIDHASLTPPIYRFLPEAVQTCIIHSTWRPWLTSRMASRNLAKGWRKR